jgi:hypothetical protein
MTGSPDGTINVGVNVDGDGSEAAFVKQFTALFEQALKGVGKEFFAQLQKASKAGLNDLNSQVNAGAKQMRAGTQAAKEFDAALRSIQAQSTGVAAALGKGFDPKALDAVNLQLAELASLQRQLKSQKGMFSDTEFKTLSKSLDAARSSITTNRTLAVQAASAIREANNAQAQAHIQAERSAANELSAIKSRYVVDTQRAAANELATIRATSATTVAEANSTARQRVAALQLVTRAITVTERGIRTAFQGTAQVVSSAFLAMQRTAGNVSSNIRQVFTRSQTDISNTYNSSWRRNKNPRGGCRTGPFGWLHPGSEPRRREPCVRCAVAVGREGQAAHRSDPRSRHRHPVQARPVHPGRRPAPRVQHRRRGRPPHPHSHR